MLKQLKEILIKSLRGLFFGVALSIFGNIRALLVLSLHLPSLIFRLALFLISTPLIFIPSVRAKLKEHFNAVILSLKVVLIETLSLIATPFVGLIMGFEQTFNEAYQHLGKFFLFYNLGVKASNPLDILFKPLVSPINHYPLTPQSLSLPQDYTSPQATTLHEDLISPQPVLVPSADTTPVIVSEPVDTRNSIPMSLALADLTHRIRLALKYDVYITMVLSQAENLTSAEALTPETPTDDRALYVEYNETPQIDLEMPENLEVAIRTTCERIPPLSLGERTNLEKFIDLVKKSENLSKEYMSNLEDQLNQYDALMKAECCIGYCQVKIGSGILLGKYQYVEGKGFKVCPGGSNHLYFMNKSSLYWKEESGKKIATNPYTRQTVRNNYNTKERYYTHPYSEVQRPSSRYSFHSCHSLYSCDSNEDSNLRPMLH